MSKFILILLAFLVLFFSAFAFVLGLVRRFLGLGPRKKSRFSPAPEQPVAEGPVLYHDSRTEVLRGESVSPKNQGYTNIRDVSFTESKTDTSSRR